MLAIQIDAAINPGNSGGPCFATASPAASCMGVAFQVLGREDAENIGYIIPSEAMLDECLMNVVGFSDVFEKGVSSMFRIFHGSFVDIG